MPEQRCQRTFDATEIFSGLGEAIRVKFAEQLETRFIRRGEVLVRQGRDAKAFYLVVSGRFAVTIEGRKDPICEIGAHQPIGEIAFLTGSVRTATVTALRDSIVLRLDRAAFDVLTKDNPEIWPALTATLADRLAETTRSSTEKDDPRPRTIAIVRAGNAPIPEAFLDRLIRLFEASERTLVVRSENLQRVLGGETNIASAAATERLNALEQDYAFVLMIGDHALTDWTEKAIRHADQLLMVGHHADDPTANVIEGFASGFVPPERRRLILVHPTRGTVSGTRRWLRDRHVAMHHHVALDSDDDFQRLIRFIGGTARGLVACGGGALCAAHVGVHQALAENGATFDIVGGTSAGSAMAAAFSLGHPESRIADAIADIFVRHKAMRRYTLPRYSLLDHINFDTQLRRYFDFDIEDLWLPFFAVSTNLSSFRVNVHRAGSLWKAIRASASIPVLLPPVYTDDGQMLVDGCLLDNVPIKVMHGFKTGPNVVVSFTLPELERFSVDYDALPSRGALLKMIASPLHRSSLPEAPGLTTVLMRSLMANRNDFQSQLKPDDQLLVPPIPSGIGPLDWHRHRELIDHAYHWTKDALASAGPSNPERDYPDEQESVLQ
jgi:NTE family protein